jgi:hypothetical protein
MHGIQSIGPPPERHADRVVAEMMRELAHKRAAVWRAMQEAIRTSSDGSPKAQRKLEARIRRAGAVSTKLTPGKRGRYTLYVYDFTGWNERRDEEIKLGDPIPERPWIACHLDRLQSEGGGRNAVDFKSEPFLFITHHAMSRVAQRLGMRTSEHMLSATHIIWNAAIDLFYEKKDLEKVLAAPPQGWHVPVLNGTAVVVLRPHRKRRALVAATVI